MKNYGLLLLSIFLFSANVFAQKFNTQTDFRLSIVNNKTAFSEKKSQITPLAINFNPKAPLVLTDLDEESSSVMLTKGVAMLVSGSAAIVTAILLIPEDIEFRDESFRRLTFAVLILPAGGVLVFRGIYLIVKSSKIKRNARNAKSSLGFSGNGLSLRHTF